MTEQRENLLKYLSSEVKIWWDVSIENNGKNNTTPIPTKIRGGACGCSKI